MTATERTSRRRKEPPFRLIDERIAALGDGRSATLAQVRSLSRAAVAVEVSKDAGERRPC